MSKILKKNLADGINFLYAGQKGLKSNHITAAILLPLNESTVAENAVVPYILKTAGRDYPDYTSLRKYLARLYGGSLSASVSSLGDNQLLTLSVAAIDDRFALEGENISEQCAKLLVSLLCNPLLDEKGFFTEENTELARRLLIEKIQSETNNKRLYARRRMNEIMFKNEACAINPKGTIEQVTAVTPESAAKAWKNMLKKASITFTVTGACEPDGALKVFEDAARSLKREYSPLPETRIVRSCNGETHETERMDVTQAKLVIGLRAGVAPLEKESTATQLMTELLGGSAHSLFFLNVREKMSLCYYCSAGYNRLKGTLIVDSGLEEDSVEKAKAAILDQIDIICRGDFDDEILEAAKMSISGRYKTLSDSADSLEAFYLGQLLYDSVKSPEERADELSQVTREQVIEAAKRIIPDTFYLLCGKEKQDNE